MAMRATSVCLSKLVYRRAVPADRGNVMQFLLIHFAKEEPCNRALNISQPALEVLLSDTVDRCLQKPFSTIVADVAKDGELVACVLNSIWKRSDPIGDADFAHGAFPENVQLFVKLLNSMHSNFWDLAPKNVNAVIHREIASVSSCYMRRGIASRLLTENLSKKALEKHQVDGVLSEASSLANQTLEKKFGFRTLLEKPYSEVVDKNGNCVLVLDDDTTHMKLNFKSIEEFESLPE